MRLRGLLGLGVAGGLVAAACGLDGGGLLGDPGALDASVDATAPRADASGGDLGDARSDAPVSGGSDASDDARAPSDDAGDDAPMDAAPPPPDAGPCDAGVICNGACVAGATDCTACPGAPLFCAGTHQCGADCTLCGDAPIQCFNCDATRSNPIGTCQPMDTNAYCLDDNDYPTSPPFYGNHCGCPSNDAGDCPGATQTCADLGGLFDPGNVCKTCGEANTDGQDCKGGGTCNAATATCK